MKIRSFVLASSTLLFCACSMSSATTITHTWISPSGSNANPCTYAAPCASISGALANTSAGGIISVEGPGDYQGGGSVFITQSVTIDGNGLASFTTGNIVVSNAANSMTTPISVTIRGFHFNGTYGGAVSTQFAANLTIENCLFENFTDIAISAEGPSNIVIKNTTIVGGEIGFQAWDDMAYTVQASLQNVTIQGASEAAVQIAGGTTEISNSVLTQNAVGVQTVSGWGGTLSVESSMLTLNGTAVCSNSGGKIRLENNDIFDNGTGVANCGGQVKTNGNNRDSGNANGNPIPAASVSSTALF